MAAEDAGGQRIEELERKLADAMRRIEALEARKSAVSDDPDAAREPITRPPVIARPPAAFVYERPSRNPALNVYATRTTAGRPEPDAGVAAPASKPAEPKPAKTAARIEYDLGAKVMPWVGSLVVIVAIGFLIGNGIERGWLTPWMQFGLAMLLSASFIGIGFWKRATREDFGGILIGLGSCGVFLSLAGGQIFHQLYSKEMLVGSFFAWGLANLGYSSFVRSRSFLVIGFLGGLAAALMPMAERNVPTNIALHFAVVIPALVIAARHRWLALIAGSWFVSVACLFPAMFTGDDWILRVGAFTLNGLLTAIAYVRAFRENLFDPKGLMPAFMTGAAGLAALCIRPDMAGSMGVAATAAAFGLVAYLNRTAKPANALGTAAALVAVMLIPLCFRYYVPAALYAVFACLCTAASLKWSPKTSVVLAGLAVAGSMLMYLIGTAATPALAWALDVGLLVLIGGSAAAAAWGANRVRRNDESWTFAACAVALPLLARMAWVTGAGVLPGVMSPAATLILILLIAALTLAHLAGRRWASINGLAWFTGVVAALVYIGTVPPPLPVDLSLLLTAAAATLILCRSTLPIIREPSSPQLVSSIGSVVLIAIAGRIAWVLASGPLAPVIEPTSAVTLSLLAGGVGMTALLNREWWKAHAIACAAVLGAGMLHLGRLESDPPAYSIHLVLLASAIGSIWYVGRRSIALSDSEEVAQSVIGIVGTLLASVSAGTLYLILTTSFGFAVAPATVVVLAAASLGCSVYLAFRRWVSLSVLSGGFALCGFLAYLWPILIEAEGAGSLSARISRPLGAYALPLAILVLSAIVISAALSSRIPKAKPAALILAMAASWPMFVQVGLLSTAGLYDPAHWNWVISGFWALYGSLVLAIGFIRDERILRFGSFVFFGATITKIFTWDLGQQIDPVLRVVILLFLGLAMLGGGYTYIKTRAGRDEVVEASP